MEAEIAKNVLRIDKVPDAIPCQIGGKDVDASYNPTIGLNLMLNSFFARSLPNTSLFPTNQRLRDADVNILRSHGIAKTIPTNLDGVETLLDFYIFEVATFSVLIGQP